ncbi:hypothetical protein SLEP1_g22526 [Rubroshorea leprosula]|uniref:Uncharacterized protein n=1 Tax=Rubroshorea leprosula TaxID=152421 RepID=A0AAV5JLH2_9ROSI|nr:hypothetical protein SLEP1_g22526 [Rubroshorea leprosula]
MVVVIFGENPVRLASVLANLWKNDPNDEFTLNL